MQKQRLKIIIGAMLCFLSLSAASDTVMEKMYQLADISLNKKAVWIREAFAALAEGRYPEVKAVAWWNENFDKSRLRIDTSTESLSAYREAVSNPVFISKANFLSGRLMRPDTGYIYHAANPDFGGTEDRVSAERIRSFESLAKKGIAWAYFSNNWYKSIVFPSQEVEIIHSLGKIPFIRMMPRSDFNEESRDPRYTLQKIIDGVFDKELAAWARKAKKVKFPLLVEFGCEANGDWFPWSGLLNGAGKKNGYGDPTLADGPERYRDAYRHIIDIFRKNDVNNVTWFFHMDAQSAPEEEWNTIAAYYPGDAYIDWIGISVYGPQEKDETFQTFTEIMDEVYPRIKKMTDRPMAILEIGITEM